MYTIKLLIVAIVMSFTLAFHAQEQDSENIYRAEATKVHDLVHTKLNVSFNFETSQMYGEEWVTIHPHFYPSNSLTLDAKAMDIHEVKVENKKAKYTYANDQLQIDLGKTYTQDQDFTVYIKYTANPEKVKQKGSAAINDAKGLYFINPKGEDPNKPTQIWTQGETESASCWFPTLDKPNQKSTEEIYITVPEKYVTLSNGELVSSKSNKGNRTDYWKMDQKHAPYLFFMGVGEFAIVKDKWRDKEVNYYVEPEYKDVARDIFGLTPEMIEFFSNKMNYDFPWNKYSQIICRDFVSGAMENTTAVLFADFIQKKKGDLVDENRAEGIIAHELFHHWFGDLVTTESWSNLTLNESFANYSEYLWYEYKYGKERAEAHRFNEKNGYDNPKNFEKDLVRFHYKDKEDMFDGVSYNKGGLILHMLRNYLGDDAFFAGLTKYLKDNEYTATEAHQLRLAFEDVCGQDLNWFFNQWYYGNGHPMLKVSYDYSQAGKAKVIINQTQEPLFQFPLTIDVYENGKAKRYDVWVNAQAQSEFTFDVSAKPQFINVNASQVLLCDIEDDKSSEQYVFQYEKAPEYGDRLQAVLYFGQSQNNNPKSVDMLMKAMNDKNFELQRLALQMFDSSNPANLNAAIPTLEKLVQSDDTNNLVKANAIQVLGQTKDPKYKSLYLENSTVVSNAIKGASIFSLSLIDSQAATEAASKLSDDQITDEIAALLIDQYIAKNDTSKMKLLAGNAAFYSFITMQDPEMGAQYQKAFEWILSSDNEKANEIIVKSISEVIKQYPQTKEPLTQIVNQGIELKKTAISKDPSNTKLKEQIKNLEELLQ